MPVVYTAVQRFDPACGERWHGYIEWSGLKQLREVASLDLILCPTVFGELTTEDWRHNVQEDFKITLFHDLDHVLRRVAGDDRASILALMQNPTEDEVRSFHDARFAFRGLTSWSCRRGSAPWSTAAGSTGRSPRPNSPTAASWPATPGRWPCRSGCGPSTPTSITPTATCGPSGR